VEKKYPQKKKNTRQFFHKFPPARRFYRSFVILFVRILLKLC
jgi:hypothetical protein